MLLLAALPILFWDGAPATAPKLVQAGITRLSVPSANESAWKSVTGITVEAANPATRIKLLAPNVNYAMDQGSASRAPWLDSNGWRFLREPRGRFYYDVPGAAAALAAAEAFAYGADALVHTDEAGLQPFSQMLEFLRGLRSDDLPPVADIGFIDDGSDVAGEVMNLMVRSNLLFLPLKSPAPAMKLTVRLGSKDFSLQDAADPKGMAQQIRFKLTDEKRSLRIYGSPVVIARLTGNAARLRIHLLNYAGAARKVEGIRVRVSGSFPKHQLAAAGSPGLAVMDYAADPSGTEFTLPELKTYAVVDLSR